MTLAIKSGLLGLFAAISTFSAGVSLAQDRSVDHLGAPATFDGQPVTRAFVRGLVNGQGLFYVGHDFCRNTGCLDPDTPFATTAAQMTDPVLLLVEWKDGSDATGAVILSQAHCATTRSVGLRSIRHRDVESIEACLAGYKVVKVVAAP